MDPIFGEKSYVHKQNLSFWTPKRTNHGSDLWSLKFLEPSSEHSVDPKLDHKPCVYKENLIFWTPKCKSNGPEFWSKTLG